MNLSIFKKLLVSLVVLLMCSSAFAQDESPFSISCDLNSRYVWRGIDFGASPSIQPGVEFSKGNLTIGAWGAYSTNQLAGQELDLYIGYTFADMFSVTVTDYFFPNEFVANDNYFDYGDTTTGHVFEVSASFDGTEKLPLTVLIAANIYGADAKRLDANGNVDGNQFSTYLELGYSFNNLDVFAGFNLTTSDASIGESGFYANNAGPINLGATWSKDIAITDKFTLPASLSLITNPMSEKVFMVFGFSF